MATQSGPGRDVELPVEVIVGTVPLRKQEHGNQMLTVKGAARRLSAGADLSLPTPSPSLDKRKCAVDVIPE